MSEANGGHITRAELAAHIKGIDEHFDVIETSIRHIEEIAAVRTETLLGESKKRWRAWGPPIVSAMVSATVAISIVLAVPR